MAVSLGKDGHSVSTSYVRVAVKVVIVGTAAAALLESGNPRFLASSCAHGQRMNWGEDD